jgi:hypothetical protein
VAATAPAVDPEQSFLVFLPVSVGRFPSHNLNKLIIYLDRLPRKRIKIKYTPEIPSLVAVRYGSTLSKFEIKLLTYNCQILATLADAFVFYPQQTSIAFSVINLFMPRGLD